MKLSSKEMIKAISFFFFFYTFQTRREEIYEELIKQRKLNFESFD